MPAMGTGQREIPYTPAQHKMSQPAHAFLFRDIALEPFTDASRAQVHDTQKWKNVEHSLLASNGRGGD